MFAICFADSFSFLGLAHFQSPLQKCLKFSIKQIEMQIRSTN